MEKDFKYITYLVGAMDVTAEGDCGVSKRKSIEQKLLKLGVYPINPTASEKLRTGLDTEELSNKMRGWVTSGHWDLYKEYANYIWKGRTVIKENGEIVFIPGDIYYVEVSDFLTCLYQKGDKPVGTFFEVGYAYKLNKPIYLITNILKKDLPGSLLSFVVGSDGEVFYNENQYIEYIKDKYNLIEGENNG